MPPDPGPDADLPPARDDDARGERRVNLAAVRARASSPGRRLEVVVFGTVSAGKTSLVAALLARAGGSPEASAGPTLPGGARTSEVTGPEGTLWLTDTPGVSGVGPDAGWAEEEAKALASRADLVLFVVDHDLLRSEFDALAALARLGKRAVVALNKKDRFVGGDLAEVLAKLRERLAGLVAADDVVAVAAAPRPVRVRLRDADGAERDVIEYAEPSLDDLEARLEAALARDAETLRSANLLLRAHLARKTALEQTRRDRRRRGEAVVERYQWMAAAATVAVPIPQLDALASGAVEYQMISEVAAVYGAHLSPEHVRMVGRQMAQTLVRRRVVDTAMALVSRVLKSSLIGFAAGGLIQAFTVAYLTRITGLAFLDYFENGQSWGEGGMQAALARHLAANNKADFLKGFVRHNLAQIQRWASVPGPWRKENR